MHRTFEAIDFDWALGELLDLFDRANRCGIYPHELHPELFYDAWGLLGEQPFPIRQRWYGLLMAKITRPLYPMSDVRTRRRYAYAVAH